MLMKEEKFLKGCKHSWKIWKRRRPRYRFGGRVKVFRFSNVYSGTIPTNVMTYWAVYERVTLQGVKDPRGTTGIPAWGNPGLRCSQPHLGGLAT
jgi:hypothetical protein